MAIFLLAMAVFANLKLATASPFAPSLEVSLEQRQGGTCSTCILGGNPYVKLIKALVGGDGQTTDDCR